MTGTGETETLMSALAGATRIIERPATATQAQSGADGFNATDPVPTTEILTRTKLTRSTTTRPV